MSDLEKSKIKFICRVVICVLVMILAMLNLIFIKSEIFGWILNGFAISQLVEAIIDFIISDTSYRKYKKEMFEKYPEMKEWFKNIKKH